MSISSHWNYHFPFFMPDQEGVIKYKLSHQNIAIEEHIPIVEINAWRTLFFKLQLIGQVSERYDGYGFGNISQRLSSANLTYPPFIISGTQTGNIDSLSRHHYCVVLEANPLENSVKSAGKTQPSSESLTHACIYQQNKSIQAVIHIHSPEIWLNTQQLKLPYSAANVSYGTPEMAGEVKKLFDTASFQNTGIFSLLGHQDGIIAFSDSIEKAALLLIKTFSKALSIEQSKQ